MLDFTKLIPNSTQIEDVVEVRVELGKTFGRGKTCLSLQFIFFLFNSSGGWVGVEINDH